MTQIFAETSFKWIDMLSPTEQELNSIAREYHIHDAFITDVLQPEHLPKYESQGNNTFFILRYYDTGSNKKVDTIQGLTNKIAIFYTDNVVITIHRFEIDFLLDLKTNLTDSGQCKGTFHLLNRLIKAVFLSYEPQAHALAEDIDRFESRVFLKKNTPPLKGIYHVKRKIEVCRKLILLSRDILEKIDDPAHQDPNTRDTRDLYIRILTLYESMSENTNHLLTIYFSISSQRTNEVIRVLTLFSVFFMPLTFLVGVYGMNFEFMPELHWKFGYAGILALMAGITAVIYWWFKRKGWL